MDLRTRSQLRRLGLQFSSNRRAKRAELFRKLVSLTSTTRILDLGGGTGAHVRSVLAGSPVRPENLCVADVSEHNLALAAKCGHRTVRLHESGSLPFEDQSFDVVWCSSVIEHVTGPKNQDWSATTEIFASTAIVEQRAFADDIRRIGKSYWVQTPARSFPVESHLWFPFVHWLPRRLQVRACALSLRYWVKGSIPDFNLLTRGHMEALFPEAQIVAERFGGLVKSWIAVKR